MNDLISCLCVTRGDPKYLIRALENFGRQTHNNRELVIVSQGDVKTGRFEHAGKPVRVYHIPGPKLTIGKLRDIALTLCRGRWVACCDDDDYFAPGRLASQLAMMQSPLAAGKCGVCLTEVTIWEEDGSGNVYKSCKRPWENTLFADREALQDVGYPDIQIGEDTACVKAFGERFGLLKVANAHSLYVYVKQPAGTLASSPEHIARGTWSGILQASTVMPSAEAIRIITQAVGAQA
jgi:glycosyltransferase involved in cell wall biosynthesis